MSPNPISWFDLHSPDPDALAAFVGAVFGWTAEAAGSGYRVLSTSPVAGGIAASDGPPTLLYVEVDDLQAACARAAEHGATVVVEPTSIPDVVTFAQVAAPEGSMIGLTLAAPRPPSPLVAVLYESAEDVLAKAPVHFAAHVEHAAAFRERGELVQIGPFGDPQAEGSMALFTSREAAEAFVADDPFVRHGVVARVHIRTWDTTSRCRP